MLFGVSVMDQSRFWGLIVVMLNFGSIYVKFSWFCSVTLF